MCKVNDKSILPFAFGTFGNYYEVYQDYLKIFIIYYEMNVYLKTRVFTIKVVVIYKINIDYYWRF